MIKRIKEIDLLMIGIFILVRGSIRTSWIL